MQLCALEDWERRGDEGVLPSWLGNSGHQDILSFCILTYLLHCFSLNRSPETNYCT